MVIFNRLLVRLLVRLLPLQVGLWYKVRFPLSAFLSFPRHASFSLPPAALAAGGVVAVVVFSVFSCWVPSFPVVLEDQVFSAAPAFKKYMS